MTDPERRLINRWRGLQDHVLEELNALDRAAIERGACRSLDQRRVNLGEREAVIGLRAANGLGHADKARWNPTPPLDA